MTTYVVDFDIAVKAELIRLGSGLVFAASISKLTDRVTADDIVFAFDYRDHHGLETLRQTGAVVYPKPDIDALCRSRAENVRFIDAQSKYAMQRQVLEKTSRRFVLEEGLVYKVGDDHQGHGKYRRCDCSVLNVYNQSVVIEEYIEGRSIRVLRLGPVPVVIEQRNQHWIKNSGDVTEIVHTDHAPFRGIIEDSRKIAALFPNSSPTLGFDYVVGAERTGLLEINHVCGLPHDQGVVRLFAQEVQRLVAGR